MLPAHVHFNPGRHCTLFAARQRTNDSKDFLRDAAASAGQLSHVLHTHVVLVAPPSLSPHLPPFLRVTHPLLRPGLQCASALLHTARQVCKLLLGVDDVVQHRQQLRA